MAHETAEAAAADLMDRYSTAEADEADLMDRYLHFGDPFLSAAFGGASPEHLEERAKAVLREADAEELRPPTDG